MQHIIRNLNLIFWGAIIVFLDFSFSKTMNGTGIKIDLINDFVGSIMICVGVSRIAKLQISIPSYKTSIRFVIVASVLQILFSVLDFVVIKTPEIIITIKNIAGLFIYLGIVMFCRAMMFFSMEGVLKESQKRWKIAKYLFLWVYLIPFGTFVLLGESFFLLYNERYESQIYSGMKGRMIIFAILLIPIIYGLVTIHTMKKEIRAADN